MAKFEVSILNAKEEQVCNALSKAIKDWGYPKAADTINEQTLVAQSAEEFINYWETVFPGIGKEFQVETRYAVHPMWGSLYPLNGFRMGIVSIIIKNPDGVPAEVGQAINDFRALLVDEAGEVGSGTQKFVEERFESSQR